MQVAASPFDLPENETIVAFADQVNPIPPPLHKPFPIPLPTPYGQALDFVQQSVYVYTVSWLWTQLSRASRQHWENLATHDPARNDVRTVLTTVCEDTTDLHYLAHWAPPRIEGEPPDPKPSLPHGCVERSAECVLTPPAPSVCFGGRSGNSSGRPLMIVASHSIHQMFPAFSSHMERIWDRICSFCQLQCSRRSAGQPYVLRETHMLIDDHISLPLSELDGLSYRLVLYSWDPGKMGQFFHYNGALLETIGATERVIGEAIRRPGSSVIVRINQEMRSGNFVYSWRRALLHFGFSKPAISKLIQLEITKFEANWTRDLIAHMATSKAG